MSDTLRFAAVILAAGEGRRMGGVAKALLDYNGKTLLTRAVEAARGAGAEPVLVVTGAFHEQLEGPILALGAQAIFNTHWAEGMGGSIACGVKALPNRGRDLDAVLVMPADLPEVSDTALIRLVRSLEGLDGISATVFEGGKRLGAPAIFGAEHFAALAKFHGQAGGRDYLRQHRDEVIGVENPDLEIDWDSPADRA